jgi:hypothetical protein
MAGALTRIRRVVASALLRDDLRERRRLYWQIENDELTEPTANAYAMRTPRRAGHCHNEELEMATDDRSGRRLPAGVLDFFCGAPGMPTLLHGGGIPRTPVTACARPLERCASPGTVGPNPPITTDGGAARRIDR